MSGETQVEVQIHHAHPSMSDPMSNLSLGPSGLHSSGGSSGPVSSGGSTGDDSSGEEPNHHHVVLPKKIRLKDSKVSLKAGSSLIAMICNGGNRERDIDRNRDRDNLIDDDRMEAGDDDCSNGPKENGTSGENSDAEGEDLIGSHSKLDDASKKMFECDVCNMRFSNGANMRRHRIRHLGIKPFECKICQKRFFRKDHLAEHMGTHSKLLPFRCPICNKGFQRQIAMRAHFQNEHVGGSQDVVKACPLCAYKAGSMKSLRVHFYSRHGIDLDNPTPHSPSLLCAANGRSTSPSSHSGEYSELAHALGFEDREKSSDSVPSHFLVPQIEISANSPYPAHFPFSAESSYGYSHEDKHYGNRSHTPSQNVSPQSDSSSNMPTSSDLVKILVKKEMEVDDCCGENRETDKSKEYDEMNDDVQEMPEDLSSGNANSYRSTSSPPKCTPIKMSPLKSLLREGLAHNVKLLRENWEPQNTAHGSSNVSRDRSDSSSGHSSNSAYQNQSCDGETITSSNVEGGATESLFGRRGIPFPPSLHQCVCVYCGIIFPDKTLYFLHKGCHSELNPWRCNICGELCTNVYDFNSHLLSKSHQ